MTIYGFQLYMVEKWYTLVLRPSDAVLLGSMSDLRHRMGEDGPWTVTLHTGNRTDSV